MKDQINETVGCAIRTVRANKGIKKVDLAEALGYERLPAEAARILQLPREAFTDESVFEKSVPPIFRLDEKAWDKAKRVVGNRLRKLMAATRCTEEKLTLDLDVPRRDLSNILRGNYYPSRQKTVAFAAYFCVEPEALYDEVAGAVGLSKEALLGNTIPDIA